MHNGNQQDEARDAFAEAEFVYAAPQPALALDEDERLPWLESADDDEEEGGVDTSRLVRFALFGVGLLVLIAGGLWFASRGAGDGMVADGGVIEAPAEPYKTVPQDQGGKTYAGTGDTAPVVSEGRSVAPRLNDGGQAVPAPTPGPSQGASANPAPAAETGGVGVQVGAYSSLAAAEAGWQRLSGGSEALKGLKHRVVEGSADIGTVYRLQAVTGNVAVANALCATLKGEGIACQVKR